MTTSKPIYLDNNATTPCAPEVVQAMLPYFGESYGNPASPHEYGRAAAAAVTKAREQVAQAIGCDPTEVIFTSGATEANNLVLLGCRSSCPKRRKVVTTAVEHKSILNPVEELRSQGFEIVVLPVDSAGVVSVSEVEELIDDTVLLVSVQGANNEVGTIQPVAQIAEIARSRGALVHCDAAQMLGKTPLEMDSLGVDYASLSAHKAYGPKGVGGLFARSGVAQSSLAPIMFGGGQESGFRPGTVNVPATVGFGEACNLIGARLAKDMRHVGRLTARLGQQLGTRIPGISVNGTAGAGLPGTLSVTVSGVPADVLIAHAPTICISNGSACSSGTIATSHVLEAIGHAQEDARSTIRISLGRYTTDQEVAEATEALVSAVDAARSVLDFDGAGG